MRKLIFRFESQEYFIFTFLNFEKIKIKSTNIIKIIPSLKKVLEKNKTERDMAEMLPCVFDNLSKTKALRIVILNISRKKILDFLIYFNVTVINCEHFTTFR